jgi:nickel/cobalt transporter (NiCoT) family protein
MVLIHHAAGMCLIDTMDGALMLSLYLLPSTSNAPTPNARTRDPITFLYYSIVLTSLTVLVAIVIGVLQLLTMIDNVAEPHGKFWEGVEIAGDHYDVIGGAICGSFVVVGLISVVVYKPWRRRVEKRRRIRQQGEQIEIDEEDSFEGVRGGEWEDSGEGNIRGQDVAVQPDGDSKGMGNARVDVQARKEEEEDGDEVLMA